jgi:cytochrome c oxidase subunit II
MTRKIHVVAIIAAVIMLYACGQLLAQDEQVIKVTAKKFEYSPKEITLKKGVPVIFEFISLDRLHGFSCPGLNIRSDIRPGKVIRLQFVPDKVGTFPFHCDNFCGSGHEAMRGTIKIVDR